MKHIVSTVNDVPPPFPPGMDRRKGVADRRLVWRGGRRDSDWVNRPAGALDRLDAAGRLSAWKRLSSVLHLW